MRHTDDKTREESVDPSHYQGLWYHHGDISLHHAHHALHHSRIGHGICWWLPSVLWLRKEASVLVSGDQVCLARLK
jgi:hypothetical protein